MENRSHTLHRSGNAVCERRRENEKRERLPGLMRKEVERCRLAERDETEDERTAYELMRGDDNTALMLIQRSDYDESNSVCLLFASYSTFGF